MWNGRVKAAAAASSRVGEPRRCSSSVRSRIRPDHPTTAWPWRRPDARPISAHSPAWSTTPQTSMPRVKGICPMTLADLPRQGDVSEVERGCGDGDPDFAWAYLRSRNILYFTHFRRIAVAYHSNSLHRRPPAGACADACSVKSNKQGCLCQRAIGAAMAAAAIVTRLRTNGRGRVADGPRDPAFRTRARSAMARKMNITMSENRSVRRGSAREGIRSVKVAKTSFPPVRASTSCSSGLYCSLSSPVSSAMTSRQQRPRQSFSAVRRRADERLDDRFEVIRRLADGDVESSPSGAPGKPRDGR